MVDPKFADAIEIFDITDVADFDPTNAGSDAQASGSVAKSVQPVGEIGRLPDFNHA
jgi:hypothetical protein